MRPRSASATWLVSMLLTVMTMGIVLPAVPAKGADPATGSLTIVKTVGEGETPGRPLEDIPFRVNRILDVALTTPEGLGDLVAADPSILAAATPNHRFGPDILVSTDAQGRAVAAGLERGVYLVREIPSRSGDVAWSELAPFLVAVPASDGTADVVVHAKNQPIQLSATVGPDTVSPGGSVLFHVVGTVPAVDRRGRLHRYVITSAVDALLVNPVVEKVWIESTSGRVDLTPGVHYTVRVDPVTGVLLTELTEEGLAVLAAHRLGDPAATVHLQLAAKVSPEAGQGAVLGGRFGLFVDGWPVPEAGVQPACLACSVTASAAVRVVVANEPPAPASGVTEIWSRLANTGGGAAATAAGGVAAIPVLLGLLLMVGRRRRQDEKPQEALPARQTRPVSNQHSEER